MLDENAVVLERGRCAYDDWPPTNELLADQPISRVRVACVANQTITRRIDDWVAQQWQLVPEYAHTQAYYQGLTVAYQDERRLGVDRWLAMLAARQAAAGQGVCVVDCGSALTLDVVDHEGRHLGGYIVPGLAMMESALLNNTGPNQVD